MKMFISASLFFLMAMLWHSAFAQQAHQAFAENLAPLVSNVRASVDTQARILTVSYDLFDAEEDSMRVSLCVSNDSGHTYLVPVDSLRGDIGYPVISGMQKQIRWYYRPEVVSVTPGSLWQIRIVADDLRPVDIQKLVLQVDSVRLRNDVTFIQGVRHHTLGLVHLEALKDSIEGRFVLNKLQTARQPFLFEEYAAANILGRKPGLTNERTTYIIDAHFDSRSETPGADDNGSGVAGMFEAARVLSAWNFNSTIKFISFDLEEKQGNDSGSIGSRQYVSAGIPSYEQIAGVFNFDMIGYCTNDPGSNFLYNIANKASSTIRLAFDNCALLYVPELGVNSVSVPGNGETVPDSRRSDHARFWDAGYKALFLTDGGNLRNPNYHNAGDTLETLNFTFMTNVVKATVSTVASLAGIQHSGIGMSQLFGFSVTPVQHDQGALPEKFALWQNYPNPFNPATVISYQLAVNSHVMLKVYDLLGREVATLVNEKKDAGTYSMQWDATRCSSGVYFYTLQAGEYRDTKRMLLLK